MIDSEVDEPSTPDHFMKRCPSEMSIVSTPDHFMKRCPSEMSIVSTASTIEVDDNGLPSLFRPSMLSPCSTPSKTSPTTPPSLISCPTPNYRKRKLRTRENAGQTDKTTITPSTKEMKGKTSTPNTKDMKGKNKGGTPNTKDMKGKNKGGTQNTEDLKEKKGTQKQDPTEWDHMFDWVKVSHALGLFPRCEVCGWYYENEGEQRFKVNCCVWSLFV